MTGFQRQSFHLCAGAVLGWHFRHHGVNAEALRSFNAERGPRVKEVYTKVLEKSYTLLLTLLHHHGMCLRSLGSSLYLSTKDFAPADMPPSPDQGYSYYGGACLITSLGQSRIGSHAPGLAAGLGRSQGS
jgi:hypothetical protein